MQSHAIGSSSGLSTGMMVYLVNLEVKQQGNVECFMLLLFFWSHVLHLWMCLQQMDWFHFCFSHFFTCCRCNKKRWWMTTGHAGSCWTLWCGVLCRLPFTVERYEEDTKGVRDVMATRRDRLKDEESFSRTTRVPGTEEGRDWEQGPAEGIFSLLRRNVAVLSASAGWGLSVSPSCSTQLSHTAVLHSVLLFWHTNPLPACLHSWGLLAWKWDYLYSVYLHEHLPRLCPSFPWRLSLTLDTSHPSLLPFLPVHTWRKFVFHSVFWTLSIQETNLCSPLPLSTPSTSGWALQLPRALHCKQPLCGHPPVPQTVGSFSCFPWLWGGNSLSLGLVRQLLMNHLRNPNWVSCRHLPLTVCSYIPSLW